MDRLRAVLRHLPPDYPVTSTRVSAALHIDRHVATIYLTRLAQAGELEPIGQTPIKARGGRQATIYRVRRPGPTP